MFPELCLPLVDRLTHLSWLVRRWLKQWCWYWSIAAHFCSFYKHLVHARLIFIAVLSFKKKCLGWLTQMLFKCFLVNVQDESICLKLHSKEVLKTQIYTKTRTAGQWNEKKQSLTFFLVKLIWTCGFISARFSRYKS